MGSIILSSTKGQRSSKKPKPGAVIFWSFIHLDLVKATIRFAFASNNRQVIEQKSEKMQGA
jgi:hypothetical protein